MPASRACRSINEYFSITRRGRKPTPPAPREMRSSVTSDFAVVVRWQTGNKNTRSPRNTQGTKVFVASIPLNAIWDGSFYQLPHVLNCFQLPTEFNHAIDLRIQKSTSCLVTKLVFELTIYEEFTQVAK